MAYKSKYKGKEVDDLLDKMKELKIPSLDDYATKQYVQQQLGDIDSILESIIED